MRTRRRLSCGTCHLGLRRILLLHRRGLRLCGRLGSQGGMLLLQLRERGGESWDLLLQPRDLTGEPRLLRGGRAVHVGRRGDACGAGAKSGLAIGRALYRRAHKEPRSKAACARAKIKIRGSIACDSFPAFYPLPTHMVRGVYPHTSTFAFLAMFILKLCSRTTSPTY
jgi:hypothetical protein